MNTMVALPIAAAVPIATPALSGGLPADADALLVEAARRLFAADKDLDAIHDVHGDDADERDDYLAAEEQRNECIATLITVPAATTAGLQAKAAVLRSQNMIADYDQHQQIAVSLADDLEHFGPEIVSPPTRAVDDAEAVALAVRFKALLKDYFAANLKWSPAQLRAHAETERKYPLYNLSGSSARSRLLSRLLKKYGADAAQAQMSAAWEKMEPLAEQIQDLPTTSIRGLRAKMLVAVWDALPAVAGAIDFEIQDAEPMRALFRGVAELTGLSPMIDDMKSKLPKRATVEVA